MENRPPKDDFSSRDGENVSPEESASDSRQSGERGSSCRGCLFYSRKLNDLGVNPVCFGLKRRVIVPEGLFQNNRISDSKKPQKLQDFQYSCIGYSVSKDYQAERMLNKNDGIALPICQGLEVLADKQKSGVKQKSDDSKNTQKSEQQVEQEVEKDKIGGVLLPRPFLFPSDIQTNEFWKKFVRSAGLISQRCYQNLLKIGTIFSGDSDKKN